MVVDFFAPILELLYLLSSSNIALSNSFETKAREGKRGFAVVATVNGSVKHKHAGSSLWMTSRVGDTLDPGDLVFIDNASSIMLRYPQKKTSIFNSKPALFEISENIGHMLHFERRFSLFGTFDKKPNLETTGEKDSILKNFISPFGKTFERPGDRDLAQKNENGKSIGQNVESELNFNNIHVDSSGYSRTIKFGSNAFSLVREVDKIDWIFPKGDFEFFSESFPAEINIVLKNPNRSSWIYVFLWNSRSLVPKWTGVSKGRFRNVPIIEPGIYHLQAYSEDGSAASDWLKIDAKKGKAERFFPEHWNDGQARWLDE